ncbi:MAG: SIMPL domain-containing protein, partial [Bergeyella zoohelcum]|nr:SIMPL domain-containing protein [Bergeyella zoohelcum]
MKKLLLIFVLFLAQNLVFAQKNFIDQPYIETSAKADSLVTPDRIYLAITIQEADSKNRKSVEEQEQAMESVLKKLGINTQKDLTLENAISYFKNYTFRGQNVLKSKSFSLLVKDAVTAGKVLMELEKIN